LANLDGDMGNFTNAARNIFIHDENGTKIIKKLLVVTFCQSYSDIHYHLSDWQRHDWWQLIKMDNYHPQNVRGHHICTTGLILPCG